LAQAADRITVLDIVQAIEGTVEPLICHDQQRGNAAAAAADCRGPCAVDAVMTEAHTTWRASLRSVTVAGITERVPASVRNRSIRLLTEAAS